MVLPDAVIYKAVRIINNLGAKDAVKIGELTHVRGELLTFGHGGKIQIGKYFYVGEQTGI